MAVTSIESRRGFMSDRGIEVCEEVAELIEGAINHGLQSGLSEMIIASIIDQASCQLRLNIAGFEMVEE